MCCVRAARSEGLPLCAPSACARPVERPRSNAILIESNASTASRANAILIESNASTASSLTNRAWAAENGNASIPIISVAVSDLLTRAVCILRVETDKNVLLRKWPTISIVLRVRTPPSIRQTGIYWTAQTPCSVYRLNHTIHSGTHVKLHHCRMYADGTGISPVTANCLLIIPPVLLIIHQVPLLGLKTATSHLPSPS